MVPFGIGCSQSNQILSLEVREHDMVQEFTKWTMSCTFYCYYFEINVEKNLLCASTFCYF